MIICRAIAELSIRRADTVPVLRNLDRSPVKFWRGVNQARDNTGLADAASVSADDDGGHGELSAASYELRL